MKKSKYSLDEWLKSISKNCTPDGKEVHVISVKDGEVIEVCYAGGQHFGSGGFYAGAVYAGNEPEKIQETESIHNQFIFEYNALFRLKSPCVVYEYSGDGIGEGRVFKRNVFVCVKD